MKTVLFATTNPGKATVISEVLRSKGIEIVPVECEMTEPDSDNVWTIAPAKAIEAFQRLGQPVITQDAGFAIVDFGNKPGARAKQYLQERGIAGLLADVAGKKRDCAFENCLAYFDEKLHSPITFFSRVFGSLAITPRGTPSAQAWKELWTVFIPNDYEKTLAEMSADEYDRFRTKIHTTSYLDDFANWYHRYV